LPILRINQQPGDAPNRYRIDVGAVDVPHFQPQSFNRPIEFVMSPQDGERIRWYLEDYLQFDEDPRLAGLGRTTIYAALGSGALKSLKIGKLRLIAVDALRSWLLSHEVAP
jgi:hypothetical protein